MSSKQKNKKYAGIRRAGYVILLVWSLLVWLVVAGDIVYYMLFSGSGSI